MEWVVGCRVGSGRSGNIMGRKDSLWSGFLVVGLGGDGVVGEEWRGIGDQKGDRRLVTVVDLHGRLGLRTIQILGFM